MTEMNAGFNEQRFREPHEATETNNKDYVSDYLHRNNLPRQPARR